MRSCRAPDARAPPSDQRAIAGFDGVLHLLPHDGERAYFVKVNSADKAAMFAAEACGLEEISRAGAVRVPQPICHGTTPHASWLALEYIELREADDEGMRRLGRNLARLHRVAGARFGWHRDNTIGSTPQPNAPADDWTTFWRERRLRPQIEVARAKGFDVPNLDPRGILQNHKPQPSLLHGDLWSGNVGFTADGPVVFDPAVYYGDREADLAMTELFGGFPRAFYDAYNETLPLDAGYVRRKHLYNLYHLLNHLNFFGRGYLGQVKSSLRLLGL